MPPNPINSDQQLRSLCPFGKQNWIIGWLAVLIIVWGMFLSPVIGIGITKGTSMDPTIQTGDIIIWTEIIEPKPGDIARVNPSTGGYSHPVAHRVINTTDDRIRTKGDNNTVPDPWVSEQRESGTVIAIIETPAIAEGAIEYVTRHI